MTAFTSSEAKRQEALELGAHHTLNSRDKAEIEAATGRFDLIISTVSVNLDWSLYLGTLAPKGRLHFLGIPLEKLDIGVIDFLMKQASISGSMVGSPGNISKMLDFASLHKIAPQIETFPMDQVNEAIEKLRSGKVHYRIVLKK